MTLVISGIIMGYRLRFTNLQGKENTQDVLPFTSVDSGAICPPWGYVSATLRVLMLIIATLHYDNNLY